MIETSPAQAVLRLENVSKTFPGQQVLHGVDLELRPGEIRALVGENGSGKSTLIKILAGYHEPDRGWRAQALGRDFQLGSVTAAREFGLRFIHQDLGLVGDLSVVDNLALAGGYVRPRWLRTGVEAQAARRLLSQYDCDVDVLAPANELSPAEQTIVAIARALRDGIQNCILVLDEPTATLSLPEVRRLFATMEAVRRARGSLLFVTHHLHEVFEIADTVTVLRDGRVAADRPVEGMSEAELIELLIGRSLDKITATSAAIPNDPVMAARDLSGPGVRGVTFHVNRGEVLGVAGLEASGREELSNLLFGVRPWSGGTLEIGERSFSSIKIREAISAGVAYAGHRDRGSITPSLTVRENITLPQLDSSGLLHWMGAKKEGRDVGVWLERLDVRPPDPEREAASLSGGNQQKVVLARWLRCSPDVLLLQDPTRGVDIGAKFAIYKIIADVAATGRAFVVFSADVEELTTICDRVLVMREGEIVAELSGASLTESAIVVHSIASREEVGHDAEAVT